MKKNNNCRIKRTLSSNIGFFITLNLILLGCTPIQHNNSIERDIIFNADWKFILDSVIGAENPDFDDSDWIDVDLPHDFSLMDLPGEDSPDQIGPFSKNAPGNGNATGHLNGGTGWYRKNFTMNKADKGKTVTLNFDGVYMESEIWINGEKIGIQKNGYTPFWFDITKKIHNSGKTNVIAVKVKNIDRNSRWYSGSGIYRNVHLTITAPIHVKPWGVYVITPKITSDLATAHVEVSVQNDMDEETNAQITINIKDINDNIVSIASENILIPGKGSNVIINAIDIKNPLLWSLESPDLYTAEIIVEAGNQLIDKYEQKFGIRTINFSAKEGFLLNGKSLLLKGGCVHHDNGLLGAAAFDRAEVRKVELLKANGFNTIRFSHNPPSKAFLDACDQLGMLVLDEFSDMWEYYKNPQDYSKFFKEYWNKDLTDMILRDRNHPSIIMWSIGNEIYEQEDTTRLRITKQLAERVRELDNTRAITQAITGFFYPSGWENTAPIFAQMDVCGYNYMTSKIESDHLLHPQRIIYTSESYPKDAYEFWKFVEKHPYVIGDFVWTSMDYLGEAAIGATSYVPSSSGKTIGGNFSGFKLPKGVNIFDLQVKRPSAWPNYLAGCGDIDITGEKRAQMLYRDVLWDNSKLEFSVHEPIPKGYAENIGGWGWPKEYQSWNWKGSEDVPLKIRVFTKASDVRLELNGKVIGEKTLTDEDEYIAVFDVPYQPGEIKAVAIENGNEVASKILKTTDEPAAIRLVADRSKIKANRNDLSFVTVEVVDRNGLVVPNAVVKVKLSISGNGELAATGNARIDGMESLNKPVINTFNGKAQAIVRPFAKAGEIVLKAEAEGLTSGELVITSR